MVNARAPGELCATAITVAEIRYGLERLAEGTAKQSLLAAATELFAASSDYIQPFDADAAIRYATIVASRDRLGLPIDGFNAQIVAICRTRGAVLATRNAKDFRETGIDASGRVRVDFEGVPESQRCRAVARGTHGNCQGDIWPGSRRAQAAPTPAWR